MYPIALALTGRRVVVVGGGALAAPQIEQLLEAGASVLLVAPQLEPSVRALDASGSLESAEHELRDGALDGTLLAFAATDDDGARACLVTAARAARALVKMRDYATAVVAPELRGPVMSRLGARDLAALAALDPATLENEVEAVVAELTPQPQRQAEEFAQLVCATRASPLAMWQTRHVMAKLATAGIASTVLPVTTQGDREQNRSLAALGSESIFVKELEYALRERRADYAVHSCKDLPTTLPEDMCLAAIGPREDPRDVFCSQTYASFDALPPGALVGTSSPRRRAQLQALRPDLQFAPVRGNVGTRLRKLQNGECDALVLAQAGLRRLGLRATFTVAFDAATIVPAVGQGALAIECRSADAGLANRIKTIFGDAPAEIAVRAERAFLRSVRGGCQAPVGAHASYEGGILRLLAVIAAADGSQTVRGEVALAADDALQCEAAGEALARRLLEQGGAELLERSQSEQLPLAGRVFLLPGTARTENRIAPALRTAGAEVVEANDAVEASRALGGRRPDALLFASSGSVQAMTGYLATLAENGGRPMVAAMDAASAAAALAAGFPPDAIAPEPTIAAFVHMVTHYTLAAAERKGRPG